MWRATAMPEYQVLTELLGFGVGVVLSLLLAQLAGRLTRRMPGIGWLVASSLLWNIGGFTMVLLLLAGFDMRSSAVMLPHIAGLIGGALFPISFLLIWSKQGDERVSRWLLRIAQVNAVWVTASLLSCVVSPNPAVARFSMYAVPFNASMLLTAGALLARRDRQTGIADRLYLVLTLVGLWGSTLALVLLDWFRFPPSVAAPLVIAKEQAPFLAVVGALFLFARFRWADVLVKGSLRVIAAAALAVAVWFICTGLLAGPVSRNSAYPAAALTGIAAALCGSALLLFPVLDRLLMRSVDRWVLRRPDYREAIRGLWDQIAAVDSEQEVIAAVEQRIRELLDVTAVHILARDRFGWAGGALDDFTDPVWELGCDDPRRRAVDGIEVDIAIPIRVSGSAKHVIAVAPGGCRRSLLNQDIEFLSRVATLSATRLDAIAAERERVERQNRESLLQRLAAESELKALRAQINPHFLFNSLNTIADLIVTDPRKAETMTVLLAKVFRRLLTHSDRQVASVSDEIDFLRTYLRIEEVRFGPRLSVDMRIDPSVSNQTVPSLILQPVVENAIKHGLAPKTGDGNLKITADRDGDYVRLAVEDDGVGARRAPEPGSGHGLRIVAERLKTLYDGKAVLDFQTTEASGSRVTILIPANQEAKAACGA